jgi:hypothetical protein
MVPNCSQRVSHKFIHYCMLIFNVQKQAIDYTTVILSQKEQKNIYEN